MYVLFDLDDTLVHSDAVREAFAVVARERGIDPVRLSAVLDGLPGRPALEVFEALGLPAGGAAREATSRFFAVLDELNERVPTVAYPDADAVLRELAARGSKLMLSTGSSPARARRVLEQEGWDAFQVVLGSDDACAKGRGHYERIAQQADGGWVRDAVTIGDSPADMRLGAEHGVRVRIGVDRDGDPTPLLAAGATHVVRTLADILPIVTARGT